MIKILFKQNPIYYPLDATIFSDSVLQCTADRTESLVGGACIIQFKEEQILL